MLFASDTAQQVLPSSQQQSADEAITVPAETMRTTQETKHSRVQEEHNDGSHVYLGTTTL